MGTGHPHPRRALQKAEDRARSAGPTSEAASQTAAGGRRARAHRQGAGRPRFPPQHSGAKPAGAYAPRPQGPHRHR
eukprot:8124462-Lingulodinium_polyedra.AAC.1